MLWPFLLALITKHIFYLLFPVLHYCLHYVHDQSIILYPATALIKRVSGAFILLNLHVVPLLSDIRIHMKVQFA
jgi:hypothetical protein